MANPAYSIDNLVALLKQELSDIQFALAMDAATGPEVDDSFEGQSINFSGWRSQLGQRQEQIVRLLVSFEPYEFNQVIV